MIMPSNEKVQELVTQLREARSQFVAIAAENIQPYTLTMLQESADALEALANDRRTKNGGEFQSGFADPEQSASLRGRTSPRLTNGTIKRYARDVGLS